jgi:hypothetical protein
MPQKMQTRMYPMSDGDLKQRSDKLITTIKRDVADFNTRNITTVHIDGLQTLTDTFSNTTTDEELQGLVINANTIKDGIVTNIQKSIRVIRNMAEIAYNSKGKYSTFGFEGMSELSPSDLCRLVSRVVRVGNKLMTDLAAQGLTAAQLTALTALGVDLDKAIDDVEEAIETRDLETQDRIVKGNALWAEMSRLASIGKSLYEDTNEAKYNDYVLTPSSGGGSAPTPRPAG